MNNQQINWLEVIEGAEEKFIEVQPKSMSFTAERAFAIQHLQANDFLMKTAKNNSNSQAVALL